jgi:hypothetical protein
LENKHKPAVGLVNSYKNAQALVEIESMAQARAKEVQERLAQQSSQLQQETISKLSEELRLSQQALREGSILGKNGDDEKARALLSESEQVLEKIEEVLEIKEDLELNERISKGFLIRKANAKPVDASMGTESNDEDVAEQESEEIVEELDEAIDSLGI